jgi:hypothetical protein
MLALRRNISYLVFSPLLLRVHELLALVFSPLHVSFCCLRDASMHVFDNFRPSTDVVQHSGFNQLTDGTLTSWNVTNLQCYQP